MAAALTGILNPAQPAANSLTGVRAMDSSSTTGSTEASITANDFLTLLVTEMKNQDPTAATDPNEYINQLVNVNSLQQLISINETLKDAIYVPTSSSTSNIAATSQSSAQTSATATQPASSQPQSAITNGNLSAPTADPSALRVAHALAR